MSETKKVTLGSGYVYIMEFDGTIPDDEVIETDENRLAYIKSGATLSYTPTFYEARDDNDDVVEEYLIEEEIILRLGLMTWTGKTLEKLSSTARVTETAGTRTVKIGGTANHDHVKYLVRFVHKSKALRVTIVGSNQNGFELAFAKDAETVIDAEFKANKALDSEGTKLIYEETIPETTPEE